MVKMKSVVIFGIFCTVYCIASVIPKNVGEESDPDLRHTTDDYGDWTESTDDWSSSISTSDDGGSSTDSGPTGSYGKYESSIKIEL